MIQAHNNNSLVFCRLQNPPHQGLITLLQRPQRHLNFSNRSTTKKLSGHSCVSILTATLSLSSRDRGPTRGKRFLGQTSCGTLEHGFVIEPEDDQLTLIQGNIWRKIDAFYRFSRPHTVIGTIIGITSVSLLPVTSLGDLSPSFFVGYLKALIPSIFMNIYVVGLNQLFDVEIDKVNKPNLPLASGEYSMGLGKAIVSAFGLMSFAMGIVFQSPPVFFALLICFLFGSAYSVELPLLRWKRNAFLAAISILMVRAITVNLAFFYHIQKYVLGRPMVFPRSLCFATICISMFTTVIALFKDIPDVDGDRDFGIQSFSVSLGQKRVFWLCIGILLIAYASALVIGASSSFLLSKLVTMIGHCTLASILWHRANAVNLEDNASVTSFYMSIWKLFYAEYLLIPFVR
ncbi:putative homogentisate phytyltransferase 1, chloroplastic [Apium graveolens]|uniref:putative homogentisate phytyltransferase 1, chloroplastic n=1 Tax=Apium graveolens TaxID=4045 RepID=UPI003D7A21CD